MPKTPGLTPAILLLLLSTLLCGCPPLNYKIYLRNHTADTAHVTFLYPPDDSLSSPSPPIRFTRQILSLNNKTPHKLKDSLTAHVENTKVTLAIPPTSTVLMSDLINACYRFSRKTLIIQHGNQSDTMPAGYPYSNLKNAKRKQDAPYHFVYRTLIYLDIK